MNKSFEERAARENAKYEELITRKNRPDDSCNGVYRRYVNPVLTAAHTPLFWRYDMDPATNPFFMERLGINAVLNSGALYMNGKYYLVARVEGNDRKSFFAVAESTSPIDGFRFHDYPVRLPDTCPEETAQAADTAADEILTGKLAVFDTGAFTVGGTPLESYTAAGGEAVSDGAFRESVLRSAPYFDLRIDGITDLIH